MSLKQVGGTAIIYAVSNGVGAAAQLLLMLYCAYVLPGDALGILTLFIAIVALATQMLGLGLVAAFQRDFFTVQPEVRVNQLSSAVWVVVGVGLAILLMLFAVLPFVGQSEVLSDELVITALAGALGQALQQFLLIIWQSEGKPAPYARFMFGFCFMQVGVPMAFLQLMGRNWESAVYGQALVFMLGGIYTLFALRLSGYLQFKVDNIYLKSVLGFSLPLVPYQLAGWGMAMLDRFIITSFCGVAIAGYYALAFQVAQVLNILSGGFTQAFTPWLYALLATPDRLAIRKITIVCAGYCAGLVAACFLGYLFFSVVVDILAKESYQRALVYVPWLFLAMLFNGLYRVASSFVLFYGKTATLALMLGAMVVLSCCLNYLLIPIYGAIAAGWVVASSFGLLFATTSLIVFRYSGAQDRIAGNQR
ncbi:oligosaccharide flippase family protein [Pseudomonas mediterranea]|uniref:lipopolysaccharide biosynthesis protein n=1 Tax=Pseudomonas mediterranea TaxID=183795 RepID=UPI001316EB45|nr:oligosaccharide flippase family protein [Pseudomonas mediterranea]QHA81705.1 oligosaccharide flippase family protein [Pseudomonas mediterranea]